LKEKKHISSDSTVAKRMGESNGHFCVREIMSRDIRTLGGGLSHVGTGPLAECAAGKRGGPGWERSASNSKHERSLEVCTQNHGTSVGKNCLSKQRIVERHTANILGDKA